ncbi:MAG TPA: hypothetical protein VJ208_00790 [Candidatus Nanoarchaeia archaeon]|nr:hypothetical protein [Candidatus Nanoarchaeia archaeon]
MKLNKVLLTSMIALPLVIASAFIYPTNKSCDALSKLEKDGAVILNLEEDIVYMKPILAEEKNFVDYIRTLHKNCPLDKTYRI